MWMRNPPENMGFFRVPGSFRIPAMCAGLTLACVLGAGFAHADAPAPIPEISPTALEVYEPDFFARYSPQNALDMISQTPGFSIQENESKRGIGQGGANVLINSRRISSKSTSARDTLRRISADKVVRIEILDGASLNIPGLTGQVANIIVRGGDISGNWAWTPEFQEDRSSKLENARASLSGQLNGVDYTVSLESSDYGGGSAGPEYVLAPDGVTIDEIRLEDQEGGGVRREANLALSHESLSGNFANLNLSASVNDGGGREISERQVVNGADYLRLFTDQNDETEGEISGDYEFGLGFGRLKLIGLQRLKNREPSSETFADYFGAQTSSGSRFSTESQSGETIARAEYGWLDASENDWQIALEGAFNFLDTSSELSELSGGAFVDVDLTAADTRIEERRAETSLVHGRRLTEAVVFQGSVGVEYSELSQTGAVGQVREFVRPKGFASLSWQPAEAWDLALRLERAVGQLNFSDFASSVNLNNEAGQQESGNPEIVPEQSWDLDLEANGDLGDYGAVRIRAFGREISDVNDSVLFSRTVATDGSITIEEGPGNLDSASIYGLELSGTLEMEPIGWEGAKLDWNAGVTGSSITDQVTGEDRPLSRQEKYHYNLRFRHDVPATDWAWGVSYFENRGTGFYRITQLNRRTDTPGSLNVFLQNKDVAGLNTQISVMNLLDREERFQRIAYTGTQLDPVDSVERRYRTSGLHVRLEVSSSF